MSNNLKRALFIHFKPTGGKKRKKTIKISFYLSKIKYNGVCLLAVK